MSLFLDAPVVSLLVPLLVLLTVNAVAVLVYVASVKRKARREQRHIAEVAAAIIDYFKRSGVNVATSCTRLPGKTQYTAFIESEPMKRFRLSHIIETTLKEHVLKSCGHELGKVYWRFPIKEVKNAEAAALAGTDNAGPQTAAAIGDGGTDVQVDGKTDGKPATDDYISEGLENYKYIPKVEATELSWEHFEQASGNTEGGQRKAQ